MYNLHYGEFFSYGDFNVQFWEKVSSVIRGKVFPLSCLPRKNLSGKSNCTFRRTILLLFDVVKWLQNCRIRRKKHFGTRIYWKIINFMVASVTPHHAGLHYTTPVLLSYNNVNHCIINLLFPVTWVYGHQRTPVPNPSKLSLYSTAKDRKGREKKRKWESLHPHNFPKTFFRI